MKRAILACFLALVTWIVISSIINRSLRLAMPGYTDAEHTLQFTLAMKFARLLMAAAASLSAGAVARLIAPAKSWPAVLVGTIVFGLFLPLHIAIWSKFPVWYHLTFLLTIIPLVILGARISPQGSASSNTPATQHL